MNSSAVPEGTDAPWTPLEEAMIATADRKAERRRQRRAAETRELAVERARLLARIAEIDAATAAANLREGT